MNSYTQQPNCGYQMHFECQVTSTPTDVNPGNYDCKDLDMDSNYLTMDTTAADTLNEQFDFTNPFDPLNNMMPAYHFRTESRDLLGDYTISYTVTLPDEDAIYANPETKVELTYTVSFLDPCDTTQFVRESLLFSHESENSPNLISTSVNVGTRVISTF